MIARIRQRATTGASGMALAAQPAGRTLWGRYPSDRLRLSVHTKPGYDGGTSDFDPGEHP